MKPSDVMGSKTDSAFLSLFFESRYMFATGTGAWWWHLGMDQSILCSECISANQRASCDSCSLFPGGLRHTASEVTSVQVLYTITIQVPGPWAGFQTPNRHCSSTEGSCPLTAAAAFLPLRFHGFSELATPQRPVGILPAQPS